jgi:hypothetical protein
MLLPPEYAWFEPVLLAAIIVFIIDVIGSTIAFSSRPVLNALASAIVFAIIFGFLVYHGYSNRDVGFNDTTAKCTGTVPSLRTSAEASVSLAAPSLHRGRVRV